MNIGGAVVIFVIWWWVVFLAVLPIGVQGRWESDDDGVDGAEPGAPVKPNLKRKMILTTMIAAGLWVITVAVILSGVFNFRE